MIRKDILIELNEETYLLDVEFEPSHSKHESTSWEDPPSEEFYIDDIEIIRGQFDLLNTLIDYSEDQLEALNKNKELMNVIERHLYDDDLSIIAELSE